MSFRRKPKLQSVLEPPQRRPPKLSELYGSCVVIVLCVAVELCLVSEVTARTAGVAVDRLGGPRGLGRSEVDAKGGDATSADETAATWVGGNGAAATLMTGSGPGALRLESGIGLCVRFEVRASTTANEMPESSSTAPIRRTTRQRRPLGPFPKAAKARLDEVTATVVSIGTNLIGVRGVGNWEGDRSVLEAGSPLLDAGLASSSNR